LNKEGGGRYVVAVGRIVNDTMQRIDTDQLMAKIETEILNSGQAVVTSAVGPGADAMVHDARDLRDSDEFDESTVAERGTLIAPELSIAGKIYQSNVTYDKKQQQVEFYIQLMISDVKTGLRYWQNEVIVGKRGSNKSVSW
ncbi:MAG: penicillin-binding protein activator LpoB, partial [Planctomycetota bacterium]